MFAKMSVNEGGGWGQSTPCPQLNRFFKEKKMQDVVKRKDMYLF